MIRCNIDGRDVLCEPGCTILEAARLAGIDIPSLCYCKELHQGGICRICVVEIEGKEKPMPSCATKVQDGMVIRTQSDAVIASRKASLDRICREHRMDCEYCPDYSWCELHAAIRKLGLDDRKYSEVYHERQADESSPSVVRDSSKCIRCNRCVTSCRKYGANILAPILRAESGGGKATPLSETACNGCGQCVRNCPTGAMFVRDDTDLLWQAQNNRKKIIFGIMPETANNIGRFFGAKEDRNEMARLTAVCRKAGAYEVFDLNGLKEHVLAQAAQDGRPVTFCPAVKQSEDLIRAKDPEALFCEKTVEHFAAQKIGREELFVVYVTPCTAAKRLHMSDAVLTTTELFSWIQRACVSRFTTLDVWRKAVGETALPLFKEESPVVNDKDMNVVYACPDGCRNGGGQFRTQACQK